MFLDAPGGSQVPDEVGDAIARTLREASANVGANYETSKRVERILATARDDAGRFLGCSSDDVVFGQNMTVLDFALSRTASRDWKEGDRILVSRLDHDGGVAPWIELAADRGFEVDWIDVTDDLRLDYDDLASGSLTSACASSRAWPRRMRSARSSTSRASRSWRTRQARSAGSTRCSTRRTSPSTCRRSVATCSSPRRTSSAARTSGSRTDATRCSSPGGRTRRGRRQWSPSGGGSRPGTAPYELLAGFSATIAYLESIGGMGAVREYERELGQRFLDGLPGRRRSTACRRWRAASRPSCSTSRACRRRRRKRLSRRARLRRLGARHVVLARPARHAAVPRRRASRRPDPLQHGRRDRPLRRRARAL